MGFFSSDKKRERINCTCPFCDSFFQTKVFKSTIRDIKKPDRAPVLKLDCEKCGEPFFHQEPSWGDDAERRDLEAWDVTQLYPETKPDWMKD